MGRFPLFGKRQFSPGGSMIKRIPLESLEPGMFVSSFDLSWFKHPFVSTKLGVVRNQSLIEELRRLGVTHVDVDTARQVVPKKDQPPESAPAAARPKSAKAPACPPASDPERTARFARKLFDQAMTVTKSIMDGAIKGQAINIEAMRPLMARLIDSVNQNENVLHVMISLKSYDDYTYTHCLNLAALAVLLGNSMGMDSQDMESLGMAGILHDVGKCLVPREIIAKPGPLTASEFEEVKRHPALAYEYLSNQQGISETVLRAVLEHHERVDGDGYPNGLSGEDIHPYSSIISVVDVYDALTSTRVYRGPVSPHMALRTLFNMRDKAFPAGLVDSFIKRLGVYPAFSVVQLRNGCYAVVMRQTPGKPLFPEVMVFCDRDKRPVAKRRVDTWRLCGELARKEFEIERPVDWSEMPPPNVPGTA